MENINLTIVDKEILKSYCQLVNGLAEYLGSGYEIVLHSLESFDHSVIAIVHGEHTGRSVGAPITDKALEMLSKFNENDCSYETYFSVNKNGEPMKSTTIAIRGENQRIIGLLCMNFYMNTSFINIINEFVPDAFPDVAPSSHLASENFASSVDEMIGAAVKTISKEVYADDSISSSNKNKIIIDRLYDKGIFRIKDSVSKVAELLSLSKNTVYLHLRNYADQHGEGKADE